jgi:hypothetical protein
MHSRLKCTTASGFSFLDSREPAEPYAARYGSSPTGSPHTTHFRSRAAFTVTYDKALPARLAGRAEVFTRRFGYGPRRAPAGAVFRGRASSRPLGAGDSLPVAPRRGQNHPRSAQRTFRARVRGFRGGRSVRPWSATRAKGAARLRCRASSRSGLAGPPSGGRLNPLHPQNRRCSREPLRRACAIPAASDPCGGRGFRRTGGRRGSPRGRASSRPRRDEGQQLGSGLVPRRGPELAAAHRRASSIVVV